MRVFVSIAALLICFGVAVGSDPTQEWAEKARAVHARFNGRKGTFAQFGDSITVTQAFWTPMKYSRRNASAELESAFKRVDTYLRPECWREWKGPEFGSEGGQTVRWALDQVDE